MLFCLARTGQASRISPAVVQMMKEAGVDISNQKEELLTLEILDYAHRLIIMGCDEDWGA